MSNSIIEELELSRQLDYYRTECEQANHKLARLKLENDSIKRIQKERDYLEREVELLTAIDIKASKQIGRAHV